MARAPRRGARARLGGVDPRYWRRLRTYGGEPATNLTSPLADGRGGRPRSTTTWRPSSCSTRTSSGSSSPSRELFGGALTRAARARSRSSTRCRSACSRRRGSWAPTSRWPRGRPREPSRATADRTSGRRRAGWTTFAGCPGGSCGETLDVDGRRLRADAAGARAAHPPREGQLEHLHEPDADGRRRHHLPRVAGTGRPRELGRQCAAKAAYAAERLTASRASRRVPGAPFFKEFALRLPRPADEVRDALIDRGFLAGCRSVRPDGRRPARRGHRAANARGDRRARRGVRGGARVSDRSARRSAGRAAGGRRARSWTVPAGAARVRRSRRSTCRSVDARRKAHRRARRRPRLPEVAERRLGPPLHAAVAA